MIVLVMLCVTANVAQIMTWIFTLDNSAGECFDPAVACSIMSTQTVSDTSKVQVTSEEAQGAQSSFYFLVLRQTLSDRIEDLIECMIFTDKPDFNCFEYKF